MHQLARRKEALLCECNSGLGIFVVSKNFASQGRSERIFLNKRGCSMKMGYIYELLRRVESHRTRCKIVGTAGASVQRKGEQVWA